MTAPAEQHLWKEKRVTDFVNPYTFVPLPRKVVRRQPPGHDPGPDEAPERYVGALEVTWHIQSPIAIPMEEWGSIGGDVRIPGSSIKGDRKSTRLNSSHLR